MNAKELLKEFTFLSGEGFVGVVNNTEIYDFIRQICNQTSEEFPLYDDNEGLPVINADGEQMFYIEANLSVSDRQMNIKRLKKFEYKTHLHN